MSESSKNSKKTSDNENNDIVFTHPVVTEKKGYMNLTDYKRNYEDMEARAKIKRVESPMEEKSTEKVDHDRSEKREDDTIVPKSSTNENDRERSREEPKATTSKITEKNENGKIDTLTNTTNENGNVSMDSAREIDDMKNDSNTSELTNTSPEEAYMRHMERVIAANALPPEYIEILKDLYTRYNFDKKHTSTIEETRAETDIETSDLGESETNTRDQIGKASIPDDEKSIPDPSLKDPNNVIQSNTQEVSKNSTITESSAMDDEKLGSLGNTDLFANNDEILTSTPKIAKKKISVSSNLENKKNVSCDVTSMKIESPFSDFSLQTVQLKTALRNKNVFKEEYGDPVKRRDNEGVTNGITKKEDNEEVNVTGIGQGQPSSSSSVSGNSQYPTSLDVSKNVQLPCQQDVPWDKNEESSITEDDLACQCTQTEVDAISNENNNVQSITYRIRRYFLSLLIDYLVPRHMRNTKTKVSCM